METGIGGIGDQQQTTVEVDSRTEMNLQVFREERDGGLQGLVWDTQGICLSFEWNKK